MALGVEAQALLACVEDLDRAPGHRRRQRGVHLPGDVLLAAKAAAHHRALDAHRFVGQAQAARHLVAVGVGNLAADIDRELVVRPVARVVPAGGHGHRALRFQEGVLGHGRAVGALDDHVGLGKALRRRRRGAP